MSKTDNEIIAEFMGAAFNRADDGMGNVAELYYFLPGNHPNPHCHSGTYKRASELLYHERWDWLMPVVVKITHTKMDDRAYYFMGQINDALLSYSLDKVHLVVVEIIKWHNSQKQP